MVRADGSVELHYNPGKKPPRRDAKTVIPPRSLMLLRLSLLSLLIFLASGTAPLRAEDLAPATTSQAEASRDGSADVEAFVRKGCPHCEEAKVFLADLLRQRPRLHIVIRDVQDDVGALERLKQLAERHAGMAVRVPAFLVRDHLIVGYAKEAATDRLIKSYLDETSPQPLPATAGETSCEAEESLECKPERDVIVPPPQPEPFEIDFLGRKLNLDEVGLPAFTLAMGLLDGFNPCSMWVLLLMISLLAPMHDRWRMAVIAGTFVVIQGIAYYVFMAAWLNLFLFIGLSRWSEIAIGLIALGAGCINIKDSWALGKGPSLSIPQSAKPGIYARIRAILQAENLAGALLGVVILGVLVQIVEFLCTSGFPALFTRILTLRQMEGASYYAYLLLYNAAYMLDDVIVLTVGVATLSQHRLQEKEGRWLKLISGVVMVGLAVYLLA
jgi:cytochrome c biogenesis protein CcdA/glutaredoxin